MNFDAYVKELYEKGQVSGQVAKGKNYGAKRKPVIPKKKNELSAEALRIGKSGKVVNCVACEEVFLRGPNHPAWCSACEIKMRIQIRSERDAED
jgi:hypothetical protein